MIFNTVAKATPALVIRVTIATLVTCFETIATLFVLHICSCGNVARLLLPWQLLHLYHDDVTSAWTPCLHCEMVIFEDNRRTKECH